MMKLVLALIALVAMMTTAMGTTTMNLTEVSGNGAFFTITHSEPLTNTEKFTLAGMIMAVYNAHPEVTMSYFTVTDLTTGEVTNDIAMKP
jgi:hypothetical protein